MTRRDTTCAYTDSVTEEFHANPRKANIRRVLTRVAIVFEGGFEGMLVACELEGREAFIKQCLLSHNVNGRLPPPPTIGIHVLPLIRSFRWDKNADQS